MAGRRHAGVPTENINSIILTTYFDMAKIDGIYDSVDDYGLITSAEARELGVGNQELVQMARRGERAVGKAPDEGGARRTPEGAGMTPGSNGEHKRPSSEWSLDVTTERMSPVP